MHEYQVCFLYSDPLLLHKYSSTSTPGPTFIIKDLPLVLILMISDQLLNDYCVVLTNTTDVYVDS